MTAHLPILTLVPLLVGAAVLPALGASRIRASRAVTLLLLGMFLFVAGCDLYAVMHGESLRYQLAGWQPPIGIELHIDRLAAFVVVTIAAIAFLVGIHATSAARHELGGRENTFYALVFILLTGLTGIVVTADLFNLYVFFEISSLAAYALMSVGDRRAVVSAYRYLLLGTVGPSFYLIAVGHIYTLTGSLNMADVAARLPALGDNPALLLSGVFIVIGVGLKMALFPMHLWLPDAYSYASNTATSLIAPVMTKVSAYVLIRILFFVFGGGRTHVSTPLGTAVLWLAIAGAVAGSLLAIAQKDAKRLFAMSSVAQVAYIGVGIGLGNELGLVGAMLHILNHATMKCLLFLVASGVALRTASTRISAWNGLGRQMPYSFAAFTVAAMAMIGIPPTNGFFSKWYLVLGGIEKGNWPVVALVVASSLLTAVYFFRLLGRIYTAEPAADAPTVVESPWAMRAPVLTLAASIILLGLFNAWVVKAILLPALPPL